MCVCVCVSGSEDKGIKQRRMEDTPTIRAKLLNLMMIVITNLPPASKLIQ